MYLNLLLCRHCDAETKHIQAGVASLWPIATEAGVETHDICIIEKNCYEYEVSGVS